MPHGEIHQRKLKKNLMLALMIFLWCALIWAVTMIRIARADEGFMDGSRSAHQEKILQTQQAWESAFHEKASDRAAFLEMSDKARESQQEGVIVTQESWLERWHEKAPARLAVEDARAKAQQDRLEMTQERPQQWWESWQRHEQAKSE